jgi:hypothetical protein
MHPHLLLLPLLPCVPVLLTRLLQQVLLALLVLQAVQPAQKPLLWMPGYQSCCELCCCNHQSWACCKQQQKGTHEVRNEWLHEAAAAQVTACTAGTLLG